MPLIMNASSKEQMVQVHGSWFTFAPGAIKEMNENKVYFLASNKAYMGFVAVPDKFSDLDERNTKEGKAELEELRMKGIQQRIQHLEWLKHNELKSMREDMDKKNLKAAVESQMSPESFKALTSAMEELKGYQAKSHDTAKERADVLKALQAELDGSDSDKGGADLLDDEE